MPFGCALCPPVLPCSAWEHLEQAEALILPKPQDPQLQAQGSASGSVQLPVALPFLKLKVDSLS